MVTKRMCKARHNLETNHKFNFKDSKMLINITKTAERLLNLALFLITILLNKDLVFSTYLLI